MAEPAEQELYESADAYLKRRVGRFFVSQEQIEDYGLLWATMVLHGCLVVRAERLWQGDGIEYTAINRAFDEIGKFEEAPWYDIVKDGDKTDFKRRV